MQNFLIVVVTEVYIPYLDCMVFQVHGRLGVRLLLRVQNLVHLMHRRSDLRKRIDKVERRNNRSGHTERENDDCEEGSDAQRAVRVEQPSERQNREHLRRKEGVSHRHAKLAAAHPVEIILRVRPHLLRQPRIGGLPLIERLDDFNAVDVFDHGPSHLVGCLHRALVVLRIAAHD